MSREAFFITDENPNDVTGGSGCICSPEDTTDCTGPFVVFPANDMESIESPHVVIGCKCLRAAAAAVEAEVERLLVAPIDVTAEDDDVVQVRATPVDVSDDVPEV